MIINRGGDSIIDPLKLFFELESSGNENGTELSTQVNSERGRTKERLALY
jgi:hypothetical protein